MRLSLRAGQALCLLHGVYLFRTREDDPDHHGPRREYVMFYRPPGGGAWLGNYYSLSDSPQQLTYEALLEEIGYVKGPHGWSVESSYDQQHYIAKIEAGFMTEILKEEEDHD